MLKRINISELRRICQAPRKDIDTLHAKLICRPISIYITILLLKLGVSANTATFIFLLIGLVASFLFLYYSPLIYFIGALLLQFWYIFDHIDGEIARYTNTTSKTGGYFDQLVHYVVHPLIFISIGLGLYKSLGNILAVIAGIYAGLSMVYIILTSDLKDTDLTEKEKPKNAWTTKDTAPQTISVFRKVFSYIHKFCCCPVFINILLIFSIINLFTRNNLFFIYLLSYAVLGNLVWIARLIYIVKTKKLDS
jgi:phosphatidylglycerophosphate synthase